MVKRKKEFEVEKEFKYIGYTYVVIRMIQGYLKHRCGYVAIDESHPLYKYNYGDKTEFLGELVNNDEIMKKDTGKRGVVPMFCWDGDKQKLAPEIFFSVHGGITYSGKSDTYPIKNKKLWWFGFDCAHAGDETEDGGQSLEYCITECKNLIDQLDIVKKYKPKIVE